MKKNEIQVKISDCPLFSVLIANYNNGKYLMDAVESVRKQTYTNWEIILVDDGSTDNSEELYKDLETDLRIHIYRNDKNMGCGYTKRRCAELANGDYCGFLDPDDILTDDALEIMVDAYNHYPRASLISSVYYIADKDLNILGLTDIACEIPSGQTYLSFQKGIAPFAAYKNECYRKTIGINAGLIRAVDQDLYFLLEEVGELQFINKPTYIYRQGTGLNISLGGRNPHKARYWELYTMMNACIRRGLSAEQYVFPILDSMLEFSFHDGKEHVFRSKAYRLGATILKPIRRLINKYTPNLSPFREELKKS